jgi:hypothetical protein
MFFDYKSLFLRVLFWGFVVGIIICSVDDCLWMNRGDIFSDVNVLQSGEFFKNYGFLRLRFTPIILSPIPPLSDIDSLTRYTHYPPIPDIVNGILQHLGMLNIYEFKYVAVAWSILGIIFMFLFLRTLNGNKVAYLSIVLMLTSPFFWYYYDNLHHIPIYFCFSSITLYLFILLLRARNVSTFLLLLAAHFTSVLFLFLTSFDPIPLVVIFELGYLLLCHGGLVFFTKRKLLRVLIGTFLTPFLIKFILIAPYIGGMSGALSDFFHSFVERSSYHFPLQVFPVILFGRINEYYSILPIILFIAAIPRVLWETNNEERALFLLTVGCIAFSVLLPQNFYWQYLPMFEINLSVIFIYCFHISAFITDIKSKKFSKIGVPFSGPIVARLLVVGLIMLAHLFSFNKYINYERAPFPYYSLLDLRTRVAQFRLNKDHPVISNMLWETIPQKIGLSFSIHHPNYLFEWRCLEDLECFEHYKGKEVYFLWLKSAPEFLFLERGFQLRALLTGEQWRFDESVRKYSLYSTDLKNHYQGLLNKFKLKIDIIDREIIYENKDFLLIRLFPR